MKSELIDDRHLARRALIYVRQSSPHQVLTNQESLRLQYDLRRRALALGWREEDIEVIDTDLGLSGAAAMHREGFKDLIARVTLDQVGIVLSSEVTRLSRNCSDWYPLLDLCGYRQCLIGDRDGVYDPGSANGRLLLGLKGTISEMELHTIRARLTAGLLNKAERGDLALVLPVGLIGDAAGVVVKDPDREVQARIELVFATFLRVRSATRVLRCLNEGGLTLPRRGRLGGTVWRSPSLAAILGILKNPAYAGSFVYGRSRTVHPGSQLSKARQKILPREQWRVIVKDKYPAYVTWERSRRSRRCCATTTPSMTATRRAACHATARRCCTGSSTAAHAATRWSCNTKAAHATSATTCADSTTRLCVSTSWQIRLTIRPLRPSSRPSRRPNSMSTRGRLQRDTRRTARCCALRRSRWRGYAIGQHWLSINLTRLIRPIAWWRLNWSAVGRKHCATCGKPKPLWPKHKRKTKFRSNSMMTSERRSPMPVGGYLKSGTARP